MACPGQLPVIEPDPGAIVNRDPRVEPGARALCCPPPVPFAFHTKPMVAMLLEDPTVTLSPMRCWAWVTWCHQVARLVCTTKSSYTLYKTPNNDKNSLNFRSKSPFLRSLAQQMVPSSTPTSTPSNFGHISIAGPGWSWNPPNFIIQGSVHHTELETEPILYPSLTSNVVWYMATDPVRDTLWVALDQVSHSHQFQTFQGKLACNARFNRSTHHLPWLHD